MKDIQEALRRKQARYAELGKQIELLQQAADKLREVAPLLAEAGEDDDSVVLPDMDDQPVAKAAAAQAGAGGSAPKAARAAVPRWP
ncbi:MAG TPA: hypothetical protein VF753_11430 [Terriglobales bacterium]